MRRNKKSPPIAVSELMKNNKEIIIHIYLNVFKKPSFKYYIKSPIFWDSAGFQK